MSFKDVKRSYIIECAKKLFLSRSISEITIKDISIASDLGEATIYRYFNNKENLVIAACLSLQQDVLKVPFTTSHLTGIEQVEAFFNLFKNIYIEHKEYYKFIAEFDSLYLHNIKSSDNETYSLGLDNFFDLFMKAYEVGLKDKTIKENKNIKLYYYTCTHSLLELCKKLASNETSLKQDNEVNKIDEIEYLISIFILTIKA